MEEDKGTRRDIMQKEKNKFVSWIRGVDGKDLAKEKGSEGLNTNLV